MKQNENFSSCEKYLFFEALYQTDGVRIWKNKWSYFSWTKRFLVPGFRWGERIKNMQQRTEQGKVGIFALGFRFWKWQNTNERERERERDEKNVTYSEIWEVSGEEIGADFRRRWNWPRSFECRWWLESSWVQLTISFFTQKLVLSLTRYYNLG